MRGHAFAITLTDTDTDTDAVGDPVRSRAHGV